MTLEEAIAALGFDPQKAAALQSIHKVDRPYLGVTAPVIDAQVKEWRAACSLDARLTLCAQLWQSNIHEARLAAAKLLTQARIKPDDAAAWDLIVSWVPAFDTQVIADHVSVAGQKRLVSDPARLDTVETWVTSDHMWTRRAALVMTLPWTKQNHPKPADVDIRDRVLGWAAQLAGDPDLMIQRAIAWWLRDLSKHDLDRVTAFLDTHQDAMKPIAVKEVVSKISA